MTLHLDTWQIGSICTLHIYIKFEGQAHALKVQSQDKNVSFMVMDACYRWCICTSLLSSVG